MISHPKLLRATRVASILDGLSYLILLFIAMPLKYVADMPIVVTHAGRIHGGLFIALYLLLFASHLTKTISLRFAALTACAAIIPFAPFFLDRKFRALEQKSGS